MEGKILLYSPLPPDHLLISVLKFLKLQFKHQREFYNIEKLFNLYFRGKLLLYYFTEFNKVKRAYKVKRMYIFFQNSKQQFKIVHLFIIKFLINAQS